MKWLAVRGTELEIRTALRGGCMEVIGTGDGWALAGFLKRAADLKEPWGLVWLQGSALADQVNPGDREVVALMEAGPQPVALASEPRLFATLVELVTTKVQGEGGCVLDLREFGLSAQTAKVIAERAGLEVSIGLKAVYTAKPEKANL